MLILLLTLSLDGVNGLVIGDSYCLIQLPNRDVSIAGELPKEGLVHIMRLMNTCVESFFKIGNAKVEVVGAFKIRKANVMVIKYGRVEKQRSRLSSCF